MGFFYQQGRVLVRKKAERSDRDGAWSALKKTGGFAMKSQVEGEEGVEGQPNLK